jgi:glycine cleavage system H protein
MMGKFPAEFPADRLYAKNHMWARAVPQAPDAGEGNWKLQNENFQFPISNHQFSIFRFGLSAYAVRLLQDVYFLDWEVEPGTQLSLKQEIGQIESSKAESSLHSPAAGRLTAINDALLRDPSAINVEKYGAGWLVEVECPADDLLAPAAYLEHLESVWEVTQRTIKGQLNE